MGTKRPFDEELQEFIKHPKHFDYSNKPAMFADNRLFLEESQNVGTPGENGAKLFHTGDGLGSENRIIVPDMLDKEFETSVPLPLVTGVCVGEEDAGSGPVFCSNIFTELFEYNLPRRQLVHFEDTYSSLLNSSPRKEIPVGPDHQADVPEFDLEVARNCLMNYSNIFEAGGGESLVGVCVIPMPTSDYSTKEGEATGAHVDCNCLDGDSIRCVQQHVKEARLKLRESLGHEKFVDLGLGEMGEEVACRWTEEEEHLFHEVVYSNPVSLDKRFWEQLSVAFPLRTKKELVSYYFNVFMLRRRAVQNRSRMLDVDSDDDEWRSDRGPFGVRVDDGDFIVDGSAIGHEDHNSSSEDGDGDGNSEDDGGEGDIVIGIKEDSCTSFEDQHPMANPCKQVDEKGSASVNDKKFTCESEQEKSLKVNKEETSNGGSRPDYGFHQCDGKGWDPPYSSVCPTKGVDLLSTCSMMEEIFGSSRNGNSTIQ